MSQSLRKRVTAWVAGFGSPASTKLNRVAGAGPKGSPRLSRAQPGVGNGIEPKPRGTPRDAPLGPRPRSFPGIRTPMQASKPRNPGLHRPIDADALQDLPQARPWIGPTRDPNRLQLDPKNRTRDPKNRDHDPNRRLRNPARPKRNPDPRTRDPTHPTCAPEPPDRFPTARFVKCRAPPVNRHGAVGTPARRKTHPYPRTAHGIVYADRTAAPTQRCEVTPSAYVDIWAIPLLPTWSRRSRSIGLSQSWTRGNVP